MVSPLCSSCSLSLGSLLPFLTFFSWSCCCFLLFSLACRSSHYFSGCCSGALSSACCCRKVAFFQLLRALHHLGVCIHCLLLSLLKIHSPSLWPLHLYLCRVAGVSHPWLSLHSSGVSWSELSFYLFDGTNGFSALSTFLLMICPIFVCRSEFAYFFLSR